MSLTGMILTTVVSRVSTSYLFLNTTSSKYKIFSKYEFQSQTSNFDKFALGIGKRKRYLMLVTKDGDLIQELNVLVAALEKWEDGAQAGAILKSLGRKDSGARNVLLVQVKT